MNPTQGPGAGQPGSGGDVEGAADGGSMANLVGTAISGRYRLVRLLGEGAMGAVYLGEHLKIGRKDAIKVLRGGLSGDAESIARFNRGARNLSAIRHPNVCTLYDYGETEDGSPFLAMEFITGESLKDLVDRERALPPDRAMRIALQTAEALAAAHHAGIVHRDLKPGNIMLETDREGGDVVKVVDFDIAKGPEPAAGEEVTRLGYVVGTPEYMSPEQLTGESLDGRSDIYSLGIVLFRMLTGALPFRGGQPQQIMIVRLTGEPLTLAEASPGGVFPAGLQQVLDRALARDRDARYARAEDLARDLVALIGRGSQSAASPGPALPEFVPETRVAPQPANVTVSDPPSAVRPTNGAGRSRTLMIVASVAVVGVAAVGATAWLMRGGSETESQQNPPPLVLGPGPAAAEAGETRTDPAPADEGSRGGGGGGGGPVQPESTRTTPVEAPEPPRVNPRYAAENVFDVLIAQNDLIGLDPDQYGVTADRVRAGAVLDTAATLYEVDGITPSDRGTAAYIAGLASLALRDAAGCARWINRALQLMPTRELWRAQLDNCERIRQ